MTDQEKPPEPHPEDAPQFQLTAKGFLFPEDILEKWVAIPSEEPLTIGPLARSDLDHLLFSTAKISAAIATFQRAFILFSHGKISEANEQMVAAGNANIEGEAHLRRLFFAIMKSVIEVRENAAK